MKQVLEEGKEFKKRHVCLLLSFHIGYFLNLIF
jgi:hypothetical protein